MTGGGLLLTWVTLLPGGCADAVGLLAVRRIGMDGMSGGGSLLFCVAVAAVESSDVKAAELFAVGSSC